MKRALDVPDWSAKEPNFWHCFLQHKEYVQKRREVSVFLFLQFHKTVVWSAPKVYGTIFWRIRGTRCLQLQERFSSFQSFLGFPLFYFLRRLKKEDVIKKKATPLIFFFFKKWYIYVCVYVCVMCSVYYFVMIPVIFFPPKFAVIFSPEGAFWLL